MEVFTAAPHHDVLTLVIQVSILLFTARALGELAQRLGQPAVIGEILAGIVLGPSLLSGFFPFIGEWLVPQTKVQGYLLEVVSMIGVMFLLLITGLETDLALIRRHARTALGAAGGGLIVPFATGFLLGLYLPDFLLADPEQRLVFALFIAAAMSISAIPVIAKVLIDLNLMRRDIGQTIIAAGMVDDTTAWIVLSIIIGLASGEAVSTITALQSIGKVACFLVLSFTAGRWLVKRLLNFVQDEVVSPYKLLTLVIILTFAWGAITQAIGLEALFGAFIMGIIFGQMPRLPDSVHQTIQSIALGIFAPIFFAVAGLKVNLVRLLDPTLIAIGLLVIFIACFGKIVGTYIGGRTIAKRDPWTSLSLGAALNARGAMEIIIATIGLTLGILSQDMFSIIVLMAMATSLMAPPALRWVLKQVEPEEEELERLRREELAKGSLVASIHRVLLPIRRREGESGSIQTIEARILEKMGAKTNLSVTLLNIAEPGGKAKSTEFLDQLSRLFSQKELVKKVVEGDKPADIILDEAKKDYDLMVLGASERNRNSETLFTPLVDYLVRLSPCATMVVHGQRIQEDWLPNRILVPTNGTVAAKHAAEIGFSLASSGDEDVVILNVVVQEKDTWHYDIYSGALERRLGIAHQIVEELRQLGESRGVLTVADVRVGPDPETVIMDVVNKERIDLIILGTAIRPGSDRLFLGPRVERILKNAPCPVILINIS
ncbi:MAG TPA: cation:proton antiporter [Thermodesulfobacteriota bacterium]|nr:cation:proton antiporter [Thermodesulfobacteriota bacterium]